MNKHVVKRVGVETSRIIKKTTLEKINHETEYIKISQNQYTDEAVDVTVVIEEIVLSYKTMHRKIRRKRLNKWI